MKIAGGCAHVATVIYYLSNARYKENFKLPGEHLKDIFYNKEIDDAPNKPRLVRVKRQEHTNEKSSDEESNSGRSESDYDGPDSDFDHSEKNDDNLNESFFEEDEFNDNQPDQSDERALEPRQTVDQQYVETTNEDQLYNESIENDNDRNGFDDSLPTNNESDDEKDFWFKRHASGYIVRNDAFFERERKKREDEKENGQENSKRSEPTQNSDIQKTQKLSKPNVSKVYSIFKSKNISGTINEIGNNIDNNLGRESRSSITITPIRTIQSKNLPYTSSNQESKNNAASINIRSMRKNKELAAVENIQSENLPKTSSRSTRRPQIPVIPERLSSDEESDIKIPKRQRVNENTANKIGSSSNQKSKSNAASINTRSSLKNNESRSVENIQDENLPITSSRSTRRQKHQEIPERLSSDEESDIKRTKRQIVNANTENKVENSSYQKSIKNTTSIKTRSMRKNNESAAEENIQDENLPITRSRLTRRPQQTENAESLSSDEESDIKIPIRKNVNENTANKIGSSSNKKSKSNAALINTRSKGKNIELATVDDIQEENLPISSSRSTRRSSRLIAQNLAFS